MRARLPIRILPQPDEITCGPTCLHAIYNYYGDEIPLERVIAEVPMLDVRALAERQLGPRTLGRREAGRSHADQPQWDASQARGGVEVARGRVDLLGDVGRLGECPSPGNGGEVGAPQLDRDRPSHVP